MPVRVRHHDVDWGRPKPHWTARDGPAAGNDVIALAALGRTSLDARAVRERCAADPVLGYEVTHRVARVLSKRLQSTRGRLITASIQPAGVR